MAVFAANWPLLSCNRPSSKTGLSVEVPRLIFLPECRPSLVAASSYCAGSHLVVTGLGWADDHALDDSEMRLWFSNGQVFPLQADASFADLTASSNNRVSRQAVLIKSLAAWTLDSLMNRFRISMQQPYSEHFFPDFYRLQEQDVLESITPRSLYLLVKPLEQQNSLRRIHWLARESRFAIEG
ncbi:hypothetical protein [Methylomonas sp. MgM2]